MPSGTRSTRGCWTCRIRKKKCDERTPECDTCRRLSIFCHAFDQRPEWMDGGERERDGTERIKQTVKEVVSRKAALQATLRRQKRKRDHGYAVAEEESSTSPLGEKIPPGARMSEDGDLEEYMPGLTPDVSSQSVQSPETITVISRAAPPQKPKEAASLGPSTIHDIAYLNLPFLEEEAEAEAGGRSTPPRVLADHRVRLLMHFLDHVFPIEFPFYNPSIFEGGRGWLLSLLMRTRPLYHAALSVSAYHHSALNTARNLKCKIQTWNELQIHHTLALKELHDVMLDIDRGGQDEKGNIDFRIDALASIVQMIAFELFVGGAEIWKTHLQAAMALFTALLGPAVTCRETWRDITSCKDITSYADSPNRNQYSPNTPAASFLCAVLVWFDILACVSTGSRPILHEYHTPLLTGPTEPLIKLNEVMGCDSEVMILISQVAELEAWKSRCREEGKLSYMTLAKRAAGIEVKLQAVVPRLDGEIAKMKRAVDEVSRLFATAALVYLHVVVSGFQHSLPEIRESVAEAIEMFKQLSNDRLLRSLVWPLCITGCLAVKEQEDWFRALMMGMSAEVFMFGSARSALRIMESCWERRGEMKESWDWAKCMNSLGYLVLIV